MPLDDPDPTDPMTLHGVVMETDNDEAMLEMAGCFIEEYARLGFDADRIMQMFRTPGYAGPYMAYKLLGEEKLSELIGKEMEIRGSGIPGRDPNMSTDAGSSLPVLGPNC